MGYFLFTHVCSEEEIGHNVNGPNYGLPEKYGELLTIDGNPVCEG